MENRRRLNRRDALKYLLFGGATGGCLSSGFFSWLMAASGEINVSGKTAEQRVAATDAARPDTLTAELAKLPGNLIGSAITIETQFDYHGELGSQRGSGTIINYNQRTGFGYGLTAKHVMENELQPTALLFDLKLDQPHLHLPSPVRIPYGHFSIAKSTTSDVSVFAFQAGNFPITGLGEANVLPNWQPDLSEKLCALTFPAAATKHASVFPISDIKLSDPAWNWARSQDLNEFYSTCAASGGASGSGVGRIKNSVDQIVGLVTHIWRETRTVITPIGADYPMLVAQAQSGLQIS